MGDVLHTCKDCGGEIDFTKTSHEGLNTVTYRAKCACHDTGELRSRALCDLYSDQWQSRPETTEQGVS